MFTKGPEMHQNTYVETPKLNKKILGMGHRLLTPIPIASILSLRPREKSSYAPTFSKAL